MVGESTSRRRGGDVRDLSLARVVEAIRPKAARLMVWDAAMPGFGIDVWPSGAMSWIYFYRVLGKQRRVKLGPVDWTPRDEARRRARAYQSAVDDERDPFLERKARIREGAEAARARREALTFADVAGSYVDTLRVKKSARWAEEARRMLDRDILPTLGSTAAAELTIAQVRTLHERMSDRPFLANRARAIVSAVMARALSDGVRPLALGNPVAGVERFAEPERRRILVGEEWKRPGAAIAALRRELELAPAKDTRRAQLDLVEALALTGAREGAVRVRRRRDVDLEAGVVRVEPVHKHVGRLVLGAAARRRFAALVAAAGRDPDALLFPGQRRGARTDAPVNGTKTASARLAELAQLGDFAVEDLRGTFASVGVELGYDTFLIGGLLGHAAKGVTERHYAQRPDALLVAAADAISAEIAERLGLARPRTPKTAPKARRYK